MRKYFMEFKVIKWTQEEVVGVRNALEDFKLDIM